MHFLFSKKSKLRTIYTIGVFAFGFGLLIYLSILDYWKSQAYLIELIGEILFYSSTSFLALLYLYISLIETDKTVFKWKRRT
jgi:hypothetical protein